MKGVGEVGGGGGMQFHPPTRAESAYWAVLGRLLKRVFFNIYLFINLSALVKVPTVLCIAPVSTHAWTAREGSRSLEVLRGVFAEEQQRSSPS